MQVKIVKFPVLQDKRNYYVSPLQFVKSSKASPRYCRRILTPERINQLRKLEQSLQELSRHYETLKKIPQEKETILKRIIRSNRLERRQMIIQQSKERDILVKKLVKQKQAEMLATLEHGDPFLEKDQRKIIASQIADVDQIQIEQIQYKERKTNLVNRIQEQKYGPYWEKMFFLRSDHSSLDNTKLRDINTINLQQSKNTIF